MVGRMLLYQFRKGTNPRRVIIYLAEKGINVPRYELDYANGEHRSPTYLSVNPSGRAPTLVIDSGLAITDSAAIVEYLEERYPERPMIGTDRASRAGPLPGAPRERLGRSWPALALEPDGRFSSKGAKPLGGDRRSDISLCVGAARRSGGGDRRERLPGRRPTDRSGLHHVHDLSDGARTVQPSFWWRASAAGRLV